AWWLRDLSRHDPDRARNWLDTEGQRLKPFAYKEAARHLSPPPTGLRSFQPG
ncbi:MAG: DNA alkylation repair protein, partial [Rhodobacteraceae bacterium]|nr:DNA alkylation repair protein [Paracoccaceae bacterium]